jgi:hypothetical protein
LLPCLLGLSALPGPVASIIKLLFLFSFSQELVVSLIHAGRAPKSLLSQRPWFLLLGDFNPAKAPARCELPRQPSCATIIPSSPSLFLPGHFWLNFHHFYSCRL